MNTEEKRSPVPSLTLISTFLYLSYCLSSAALRLRALSRHQRQFGLVEDTYCIVCVAVAEPLGGDCSDTRLAKRPNDVARRDDAVAAMESSTAHTSTTALRCFFSDDSSLSEILGL